MPYLASTNDLFSQKINLAMNNINLSLFIEMEPHVFSYSV